jgi:hypothetical protein
LSSSTIETEFDFGKIKFGWKNQIRSKLSEDVRARPEVSAIVSRLEQVESLINETRKAMGGGRIESSKGLPF